MRPMTLFIVLAVAALVQADDTYVIKIKVDPDVGRSVSYRCVRKSSGVIRTFDADGKPLGERKPDDRETACRTTVLEVDKDGRPTKYVRVYEMATETVDGKTESRSYQGRTLLFEKSDGRVRVGVAGEPPLDPDDVARLTRDANQKSPTAELDRHLAPSKPVRVGETWSVPVKPIMEALDDLVVDPSKSSIAAKLVKVSDRGATRFGTFEITSRYVVTALMEGGIPSTFDPPGVITDQQTVELAIDGSSAESSRRTEDTFKAEGVGLFGGVKRRIMFDMSVTNKSEHLAAVFDSKARVVPSVRFAPAPDEWTEFKPKAGTFLAKFPGQPKEVSDTVDGYRRIHWSAKTDDGMIAYGVSITEFADPTRLDEDDLKAAIDALPGVKSRKDIQVNGFVGVDVVWERDDSGFPYVFTCRFVAVNGRLFHVFINALRGKTAETDKFLKSFQLLEKPRTKDN